ncbi:MAG TPA: TlpA disulfide reductase family protein [Gallionella sp.]
MQISMRTLVSLILALILSAPALADTPGEVKVGALLRDTPLHSFTGPDRKFSDYRGKPLIINVWASWCGPCRLEMGSLQRLERRYGGRQFNVIGISTDDDRTAAAAFINRSEIAFENFLDSHLVLENMLGADTIPLTVLVDADGRVLEKVHGAYEWDSPEIVDAIAETFRIRLKR